MGIGDSARDLAGKAKEKVSPDQARDGVEKGGDKLDDATGHRYESQVDKGQKMAEGGVDKVYRDDDKR